MSDVPETITITDDGYTLPVTEVLAGRAFITGKSGSGKSILGGTPVYTENGRKPIEDVEEGETVLSLNRHTYEQEFREVLATIEHEADDLIRITLEDGTELVGTEDHSFLTVRDLEIVPILGSDVEPGTWIPLSREIPATETIRQIDLAEYVIPADNVQVREDEIQSSSAVADRFLDLTFDSGKVLGLYLAEGSLSSRYTIQISNVDVEIKGFLGSQGFKVYERTSNRSFKPYGEFVRQEFGTGSAHKRIPDWVYNAPSEFKAGLLSGYFDGDGTVNDYDVTVISKSPDLISGIKELLRHFGISATIRDEMVLDGEERLPFKRLTVDAFCLDRFAEVVDLSVVQKREKLGAINRAMADGSGYNTKDLVPNFGEQLNLAARERGWTQRESGRRSAAASLHNFTRKQKTGRRTLNRVLDDLGVKGRLKDFAESDIQWKRVVSVEEVDETRTVYDLDVAYNDNFIANGAFVHNSNSASVIVEELLENNFTVLIVDSEGEYFGLKERYEVLHVGADAECDIQVGVEHAAKLAELSLIENVPVILDISGYLDADEGRQLVLEVVRTLFRREKTVKKPFLLVVEEIHEFLPETGGLDELGEMLVRVAKRGRKRGLGLCGMSQRPAAVDKDFITQCDWLVWHRLTWDNDTRVVKGILGAEAAETVQELGDGEALVMTDWDGELRRIQFRRKRTFDAGATPGLGDFERPDLKSVGEDLIAELQAIGDQPTPADHEELEAELRAKNERIADLESTVADLREELSAVESALAATEDALEAAESDVDTPGRDGTAPSARSDRGSDAGAGSTRLEADVGPPEAGSLASFASGDADALEPLELGTRYESRGSDADAAAADSGSDTDDTGVGGPGPDRDGGFRIEPYDDRREAPGSGDEDADVASAATAATGIARDAGGRDRIGTASGSSAGGGDGGRSTGREAGEPDADGVMDGMSSWLRGRSGEPTRDRRRRTGTEDEPDEDAVDPLWEVGDLMVFLFLSLGATVRWAGLTVADLASGRGRGPTPSPLSFQGRSRYGRPWYRTTEAALAGLVAIGLAVTIGLLLLA